MSKILIVDDDKTLRETIAFDFSRRGFDAVTAENGQNAFEIIRSQKIDVVLSDVRMPGGSGLELLKNIRTRDFDQPVFIFISGYTDMTAADTYALGADALFNKPFDRKTLASCVDRLLLPRNERWSSQQNADCPMKIDAGLHATLGRGGVFVHLDQSIPKEESTVHFDLRETHDLSLIIKGSGIVRWSRNKNDSDQPPGCGIEFVFLNEDCRPKIIQKIESQKIIPYIPKD